MTLQDEIRLLLQAPMMNAHDVRTQLRLDHDEALQIARDMVDADGGEARRLLLRRLRPTLLVHLQAVQREVYSPLRKLRGSRGARSLMEDRTADHQELEAMLTWLAKSRKTESIEWASRAQLLLTLLRRHVEAEQGGVFLVLGEHFDDASLARMAQAFLAEKARLVAADGKASVPEASRDLDGAALSGHRLRHSGSRTGDECVNDGHSIQA